MTSGNDALTAAAGPYQAAGSLKGTTILMSGGSRGIGLAIAVRAARDGANIVLMAKTGEPHPKLAGTVHTAAREVVDAGGQALPLVGDVRRDEAVAGAVAAAVDRFGGIDVVINNAEPGPPLGGEAPGLHHGQIRHEPDHAGTRRGT